jgi:hypothetical protein
VRHVEVKVSEPIAAPELPSFITGIPPRVEAMSDVAAPVKRPRGRPRKIPLEVVPTSGGDD